MNFDPFNKLNAKSISILHEAYAVREKGWTHPDYKGAYSAFCAENNNATSATKFDALVRWWGDMKRHKSTNFEKTRQGNWQMTPNKMMTSPKSIKASGGNYTLDDLHDALVGRNLR